MWIVVRVDRDQDFSSDGVFKVQGHRYVGVKVPRSGQREIGRAREDSE